MNWRPGKNHRGVLKKTNVDLSSHQDQNRCSVTRTSTSHAALLVINLVKLDLYLISLVKSHG